MATVEALRASAWPSGRSTSSSSAGCGSAGSWTGTRTSSPWPSRCWRARGRGRGPRRALDLARRLREGARARVRRGHGGGAPRHGAGDARPRHHVRARRRPDPEPRPGDRRAAARGDHALPRPGSGGVGLGGSEVEFPPGPFAEVYAEAARRGFHRTAHAGEVGGPDSVRAGARPARRRARGPRDPRDRGPALVARLARDGVPLTVCPTSNVRTGAVPSLAQHPLRRLYDAGVRVTVNSDDPTFFGASMTDELWLCMTASASRRRAGRPDRACGQARSSTAPRGPARGACPIGLGRPRRLYRAPPA